jgi:predicted nucleotidyltransferase
MELEETLGRRVDLVTYDTVNPLIKRKVMAEKIDMI